ncbi:NAD-P-binding protein [Gloeopeniophorella convolvens]|nr:NAD-P-binding protein [Gloeopeniophorella convolvens]
MSLPQTHSVYRAKDFTSGPSALVQGTEPLPTPQAHEVLVRIRAVSLNYRDTLILRNGFGWPVKDNIVLGGDAAGEIAAVGPNAGFNVGDRVVALFDLKNIYGPARSANDCLGSSIDGTLQEYRIFSEEQLLRYPQYLSFEEASCLPIAAVTAWNALFGSNPLLPGQTVVFQGTGGVSIAGLQIAHAAGAVTIVTSSSNEKLELAKKLGATHTVNYKEQLDWAAAVNELTRGGGADNIFDNVGLADTENSFKCIAPGGIISAIGFLGGRNVNKVVNVPLLSLVRIATLRGIRVGSKQQFEDLLRFYEARQVHPYIDRVFSFDQTVQALEYLESGQHFGKIVVSIPGQVVSQ